MKLFYSIHYFIATGFHSGLFPKAPGTAGSLAALLIWYTVAPSQQTQLFLILATILVGTWSSHVVEKKLGKDPSRVVIDEFAGMFVSLFLLPQSFEYLVAALILFRFFDILKPLGINFLQSIKGGVGIMIDDILAGIYTAALIHGFIFLY